MSAQDVELADTFLETLEAAVRTGRREAVYALLAPDVEWVTPQRTLHGIDEMRQEWSWGSSPEAFDYEFETGDWVDDGEGRLACDVLQVYRLKESGDFAYKRNRRVHLTIHDGRVSRFELGFVA